MPGSEARWNFECAHSILHYKGNIWWETWKWWVSILINWMSILIGQCFQHTNWKNYWISRLEIEAIHSKINTLNCQSLLNLLCQPSSTNEKRLLLINEDGPALLKYLIWEKKEHMLKYSKIMLIFVSVNLWNICRNGFKDTRQGKNTPFW